MLERSRYAVPTTARRERWWYSDGIWLNQGNTGDVVGFAWTHWLADRGVAVPGAELGEEYAHQLQREAQRQAGGPEGPEYGGRLEAAARVLQARGLVEQCYCFASVDSVVGALLERGPVLAGLTWYQDMRTTADVGGWALCRYRDGDSVAGGHAVLLNGIALDLTLDGVTGFVRFKNTWGRGWGDRGQALLSIADLSTVMSLEGSFLPIPAAAVLRSGVRQDTATDEGPTAWGPAAASAAVSGAALSEAPDSEAPVSEAPDSEAPVAQAPTVAPEPVRFEQSSISGDQSTRRDTLGAAAYAEAIARGIQHPETKAPLTIGIKAPWGAGKTSLMRMIRDRLEFPGLDGSSENPREIHLTPRAAKMVATSREDAVRGVGDLGEMTNKAVLRKLRRTTADSGTKDAAELKARPGKAGTPVAPEDERRWRPTVWFNPWMYQTGDQVWAGLANEIINQVTDRMSRREREHFWLHLNRKRIDEQAVRRKIYSLVLGHVIPYAIFGLVLLTGGIVLLAAGRTAWLGGAFALAGPAAALVGGGFAARRTLSSRVGSGLSGLIQPATAAQGFAAGELPGAYAEVVASPDYRAQSGYFYLVQTDVKRVLDLVATDKRPLVIFVDDLDRCSPSTVVQVIEAINIFVAGDYTNCMFVIAMEPEMVAAHIEAAYSDLVSKLDQTSTGRASALPSLGWRFLEKIVQLPLALPAMEPKASTAFIASLFPAEMTQVPATTAAPAADDAAADAAAQAALRTATLSEAVGIGGGVRPDAPAGEEVRLAVERRLTADDPEVKQVIEYASGLLNRNPREIKRFVNLFRFYTMIYAERKLANLPAPGSLHEVAKIAVLGIRWPSLLGALATIADDSGELTVFELLEAQRAAKTSASLKKMLADAGLTDATIASLQTAELTEFLRTAPVIGPGVRGYL